MSGRDILAGYVRAAGIRAAEIGAVRSIAPFLTEDEAYYFRRRASGLTPRTSTKPATRRKLKANGWTWNTSGFWWKA